MTHEDILEDAVLLALLLLLVSSILLIAHSAGNSAVSVLDTAASITLSTLLVWFYSKQARTSENQSELMEQQAEIMEKQQEITELQLEPNLTYGSWKVDTVESSGQDFSYDVIRISVHNIGKGDALDCRFGLFCKPVSEYDDENLSSTGDPKYDIVREQALSLDTNLSFSRNDTDSGTPGDRVISGENVELEGTPSILVPTGRDGHCLNAGWSQFFQEYGISEGEKIVLAFRVDYEDVLNNEYREIPFCAVVEFAPEKDIYELLDDRHPMVYGLEENNKMSFPDSLFA